MRKVRQKLKDRRIIGQIKLEESRKQEEVGRGDLGTERSS
jgi:hypothetical protein